MALPAGIEPATHPPEGRVISTSPRERVSGVEIGIILGNDWAVYKVTDGRRFFVQK